MDANEFKTLMGVAVLERARAIAIAEDRFQQRVAALRAVRELSAIKVDAPPSDGPLPKIPSVKRGDVMARVKLAVLNMPDEFNLRDLVTAIQDRDMAGRNMSAKAISAAVKRLVGKFVEIAEKGSGKRGSRYRRTVKARPQMTIAG